MHKSTTHIPVQFERSVKIVRRRSHKKWLFNVWLPDGLRTDQAITNKDALAQAIDPNSDPGGYSVNVTLSQKQVLAYIDKDGSLRLELQDVNGDGVTMYYTLEN